MKHPFERFVASALLGLLLVSPFAVMEAVNRRNFDEVFPVPLFLVLWLLPALFVFVLTPVVEAVRAGRNILLNPFGLLTRAILLSLFAIMWLNILADQWPCFMGVLNCD